MAKTIKSINLLPEYFRTDKNSKFLSSTIDQFIQPPDIERIDGYIGSKLTPNFKYTDDYISEVLDLRRNYQLEPALTIANSSQEINDVIGIDDLINEISIKGGDNRFLNKLFTNKIYSYNPHIDFDKLINYQEYYWLTNGPSTVLILGQEKNSETTFAVRDGENGVASIINSNNILEDSVIVLYRGNTYNFDVDSKYKFYIKTAPNEELSDIYNQNVQNNGIKLGNISINVTPNTPSILYWWSDDENQTFGKFVIKDLFEDTGIDVETEILNKKNYISSNGLKLSNGMKVKFGGQVLPEYYKDKVFFVEGVGSAIKLIDFNLFDPVQNLSNIYDENFDANEFDEYPFDNYRSLPITPEYLTINRASNDLNPWSRYNRWVHRDVIETSDRFNGKVPVLPADKRAKRPIIEFKANLKLYNFGEEGLASVDLIDTETLDAFSKVNGTYGYYVDGVLLQEGHRVVFNADTDSDVRSKIFQVHFVFVEGKQKLELIATDELVKEYSSILVRLGSNRGTNWWFDGDTWLFGQQHTELNQAPLFDLFDNDGISLSNTDFYRSNFVGNKVFSYEVGTGTDDVVLGFPLKYRNSLGIGSFLFKNFFGKEEIAITQDNQTSIILTKNCFLKFSNPTNPQFVNVWTEGQLLSTPILQFQVVENDIGKIEITSVQNVHNFDLQVEVYVNLKKLLPSKYTIEKINKKVYINFYEKISANSSVLLKIYSDSQPTGTGYYELPLSLTNNPENGIFESLTLSEISEHVQSMTEKNYEFNGQYPGNNNLRDLFNYEKYGNKLIYNSTPISFAQLFLGKKEHNLIDAISKTSLDYYQFQLSFLRKLIEIGDIFDPVGTVDIILNDLNKNKNQFSPYYWSDMVAYGTDKNERTWIVTDSRNTIYPLREEFNDKILSRRSIFVYINGEQQIKDRDYRFINQGTDVEFIKDLYKNDNILIVDYFSTEGSFVPPTPSKLGLYPKFVPEIYFDDTFADGPKKVIQGHDGSIMIAFNDFRDTVILELERRIFNNIKIDYDPKLFDIYSIVPGYFRETDFSKSDIDNLLYRDFVKWAGTFSIEFNKNPFFDEGNDRTWNYTGSYSQLLNYHWSGSWKNIYRFLYDTDRPHSHPWEMLGFPIKPIWWDSKYGEAPYTSGNEILWTDIEKGFIAEGDSIGINVKFIRPGLRNFLPVDDQGNLVSPTLLLASNITDFNKRQGWKFGDLGAAEYSWRRSSLYPFAIQRVLALSKPIEYCSLLYDPSRLKKNIANQTVYGDFQDFITLKDVVISGYENNLTNGYSVFISEQGITRDALYLSKLKSDKENSIYKLFYKVGGFVSKNKLQIIIDSIDPTSSSPGTLLPNENYSLLLNVSNPVKSISISGVVIQKVNGKYSIKGYDRNLPLFKIYAPIRTDNTTAITVGGISESYVSWSYESNDGQAQLASADTTSAQSVSSGKFYQQGQIVQYNNNYYRVKVSHRSDSAFNESYFTRLPSLPIKGGVTVQLADKFETTVTEVPYGTEYVKEQEVFDLLIGYQKWLEEQGFIFDEYNKELFAVLDWELSGKEFLYWTVQNWANNSVITLSPFANKIKYKLPYAVVDNVFDSFYEYSLLQANGTSLPQNDVDVIREDGTTTITTQNNRNGIYFAIINSVQKEHAMVFDNFTQFADTIFNPVTGYKQRRMKITGFRTGNWNGDYLSPGFVYDTAQITDWKEYVSYKYGDVVRYKNAYYSAKENIPGSLQFDFSLWIALGEKPVSGLLPNFDYKINQFEDFYTLDIDNFDTSQQELAQHLIGYTPRVYLNNVFPNPIAQYKFYQGFIKEKGTRNAITKLSKASLQNFQGELTYTEEWAFRVGQFGSFSSYQEIEFPLTEGQFVENPQIVQLVTDIPITRNELIYYTTSSDRVIQPDNFNPDNAFVQYPSTLTETNFALNNAGYVHLDDITATAYNENSLLDIANNRNLTIGDVIWLGFKSNGDWDVYRYTKEDAKIVGVYVSAPLESITFTTNVAHKLQVGQLISVSQFNDQVNGIYIVKSISSTKQFTVASSLAAITDSPLLAPGLLFSFKSYRFDNFDNLPPDRELIRLPLGTKFWVDNANDGKWAVYERENNYSSFATTSSLTVMDQRLGYNIHKRKNNNTFIVGSPGIDQYDKSGRVSIYEKIGSENRLIFRYTVNETLEYVDPDYPTEFGYSVFYDDRSIYNSNYGLFFAGAPGASYVKGTGSVGDLRYSTGTEAASTLVQEGIVKISTKAGILDEEETKILLLSPEPKNYERFGSALFVQRNTDSRLVLVGAPGNLTSGYGSVYAYRVNTSISTSTFNTVYLGSLSNTLDITNQGSLFGNSINGSEDASTIAVGAPGYPTIQSQLGVVFLYTETTYKQTINSPFGIGGRFGEKVAVSPSGVYLAISAPGIKNANGTYGKVAIYKRNNLGVYVLDQILENPEQREGLSFGIDIDFNLLDDTMIISSLGTNRAQSTTFDDLSLAYNESTFDSDMTTFYGSIELSGTVYMYTRKDVRFVLTQELSSPNLLAGNYYGKSIVLDDDVIFVGSPAIESTTLPSGFYQFNKLDLDSTGWVALREQVDLVDIANIQRVNLIDTFNEVVIDYLDVIDPIKGKIAGLAEQEITYKSSFDPAVYSIGIAGTVNDTETNWMDEHVGELWWDLSSVKYIWYEQDNTTYRKNNWGRLFPGSSIDVYEWVGSQYLPTEWSALADTAEGLASGISGQPKFADNSVISVKQIYNPTSNSFSNYYFYWVKNKIIVPSVRNRRISSYQVASLIADPVSYGIKKISFIDKHTISLGNVGVNLVDKRIHINIAQDILNNKIPRHTEWLLLQENDQNSVPNTLLEKKLIDSLLGKDQLGNLVPNPSLSFRERYGLGIRPQQTIFKNRFNALRNLLEFTNSILIKNRITGNYSFQNLMKQEEIPNIVDGEYDRIVDDVESLQPEVIDVSQLKRAIVTVSVYNGKIQSCNIIDSGFGYITSPTINVISNTGIGGELKSVIDNQGRVIEVKIENAGSGYLVAPIIEIRPYTVIVLVDSVSQNKWAKYILNYNNKTWNRIKTQEYNTNLYWEYIDWKIDNFNQFKDYTVTVNDVYELQSLELQTFDYVKVKNNGLGNYIILEKIDDSSKGTFAPGYDVVYVEKGTIRFKDSLWNLNETNLSFDSTNLFDETLFDQFPDKELFYILTAIKEDLFVNNLKINWNKFFFQAVKFAMSEQKLLDWAFKTSFINVKNKVGTLDQRPVYKLTDSTYYEDYLKEVKPYRSQIRSFTTEYDYLEESKTFTTDFDLPAIYDKDNNKFVSVDENSDRLNEYPWKAWNDNFPFEIGEILIGFPGAGYTFPPEVIIETAPGDTGSGATARAFIRSGEVISVEIINPGSDYKVAPIIKFVGGGDANLVTAIGYAKLENKKVRNNLLRVKFDRISKSANLVENEVTDSFLCNGSANEFLLTWLSVSDKELITVKIDNTPLLKSDYTIIFYSQYYNGYNKKFSKLKLLKIVPVAGQIVSIAYQKSYELFDSVQRILTFYNPGPGLPGPELSQLMQGIEYPKTRIEALPFNYSTKWDIEYNPYDTISYSDDVTNYSTALVLSTSTASTNVIKINTNSGISVGQFVNVISTLSNKFSTSSNVIITAWNTVTQIVTVNSTLSSNLYPGDVIEFWSADSNYNILDSAIDGGTWSTSTSNILINALGINPEDVIIDGDKFYTVDSGYSPEELVSGFVADSLAINVYTKNPIGSPTVFSNNFDVPAGVPIAHKMKIVPPSAAHITVTFGKILMEYTSSVNFVNERQFRINWETNELIIPEQIVGGKVGYTIIQIGGGSNSSAGVLDYGSVTSTESSMQVRSLASAGSVNSAFVTVNGLPINRIFTTTEYGYVLTFSNLDNRRAAVNVYNLPAGENTVIAWFFASEYGTFNEVREQEFTIATLSSNTFQLSYPPGNVEPFSSQVIVEYEDIIGYERRRLLPPYVSYYEIKDLANKTFAINDRKTRPNSSYSISLRNVKVYINGQVLRPGFDYTIASNNTITISPGVGQIGDAIAILDLYGPSTEYEFSVDNNILYINIGLTVGYKVKIITFNDHDQMLVRQERFEGLSRFKLGRAIENDNYCWISINGIPLTPKLDFEVLEDGVTIQISDVWLVKPGDEILVTSIASQNQAGTVLGYRIFQDILGRTHFKRLSKDHTTYLTKPLTFTDTEIHVADARKLTTPNPSQKIPGVVLIDGERIEFYKVENNTVLKQLRRATLGTSPSFYAEELTKVIDQGVLNTVPYGETILRQNIITSEGVNTYTINTITNKLTYGDGIKILTPYFEVVGKALIKGKGAEFAKIALRMAVNAIPLDLGYDLNGNGTVTSADALGWLKLGQGRDPGYPINPNSYYDQLFDPIKVYRSPIPAVDQLDVYYGGRLLRKSYILKHDISLSYDSPEINLIGTTSTVYGLPNNTTVENTAYLIETTNQIWVYTKSLDENAVNGYEYKGLNYLAPEFTINTSTNQITLNIEGGVKNNIELAIVAKQITTSSVWNNIVGEFETLSILESTTKQAKFLQLAPAELPDIYYYGGDPELTNSSGFSLTDENDDPLEGF